MATTWHVVLYQPKPVDIVPLEVFSEEADAMRFAETYIGNRASRKVGKRRWRMLDHDLTVYLDVYRRTE